MTADSNCCMENCAIMQTIDCHKETTQITDSDYEIPEKMNSTNETFNNFVQVVSFLCETNLKVRLAAVEIIISLSDSKDFVNFCRSNNEITNDLPRNLLKGVGSSYPFLTRKSLEALVNLSEIPEFVNNLIVTAKGVNRLMEWIRDEERQRCPCAHDITLGIMLLANLTRCPLGQYQLLGIKDEANVKRPSALSQLFLHYLIKQFSRERILDDKEAALNVTTNEGIKAQRNLYIAYILINVTSIPLGRECFFRYGKKREETIETINILCENLVSSACSLEKKSAIVQLFLHLSGRAKEEKEILGASTCLFFHALCCLVYPSKYSKERRIKGTFVLPEEGLLTNGKEIFNKNVSTVKKWIDSNENPVLLHSFIDLHSNGPVPQKDIRFNILLIFQHCSQASLEILEKMKALHFYEVFRVWHLLESESLILNAIENLIPVFIDDSVQELNQTYF